MSRSAKLIVNLIVRRESLIPYVEPSQSGKAKGAAAVRLLAEGRAGTPGRSKRRQEVSSLFSMERRSRELLWLKLEGFCLFALFLTSVTLGLLSFVLFILRLNYKPKVASPQETSSRPLAGVWSSGVSGCPRAKGQGGPREPDR